jgi:hypothetical protein
MRPIVAHATSWPATEGTGDLGDEAGGLRQERLGRPDDLGQVAAHAGAQRAL